VPRTSLARAKGGVNARGPLSKAGRTVLRALLAERDRRPVSPPPAF